MLNKVSYMQKDKCCMFSLICEIRYECAMYVFYVCVYLYVQGITQKGDQENRGRDLKGKEKAKKFT